MICNPKQQKKYLFEIGVTFFQIRYKYQIIILKFKQNKMKKVILAIAIVSVTFAACNNGDSKESTKPDSTAVKTDSPAVVAPKVDSPAVVAPKVDSPKVEKKK